MRTAIVTVSCAPNPAERESGGYGCFKKLQRHSACDTTLIHLRNVASRDNGGIVVVNWIIANAVVLAAIVAVVVIISRVFGLIEDRELSDDNETALAHDSAWALDSDFD